MSYSSGLALTVQQLPRLCQSMEWFCQKILHHIRKPFSSSSSLSSSIQEGSLLSPLSLVFLCSGASTGIFSAETRNKFEQRWQGSGRESKTWTKTLHYCLFSAPVPCCLAAELFLVPAILLSGTRLHLLWKYLCVLKAVGIRTAS